ncbi:MAG: ABC transporter permease [Candidatus Cyclobacteriaceae bacterium M2_1C_046]
MWRNYLKTAFRHIRKRKLISFINILSLTLGIAVCILVYLFVHDELTYDQFHVKKDRIYRINSAFFMEARGEWRNSSGTSPALKKQLEELMPGFEKIISIDGASTAIRVQDEFFNQSFLFADEGFFEVFSFPLIKGSLKRFQDDPSTLIIDQSTAKTWFGDRSAIGEIVDFTFNGEIHPMEVVGIMEEVPGNSSLQFEVLVPFKKYQQVADPERMTRLFDLHITSFALAREGAEEKELLSQLDRAFKSIASEEDIKLFKMGLQPLTSIHLDDKIGGGNGMTASSSITTSYILGGIGFLILIIGCFNYINLSFGVLLSRVKEIGIRKIIGAGKKQLIFQYIIETLVVSVFAFGLSILLVDLTIPYFELLSGKSFRIYDDGFSLIIYLLIPLLIIIILTALYPAAVSTRFSPAKALKGNEKVGGKSRFARLLVVLQFSIGVVCAVVFLTVNRQLNYINNFDLGYNEENIISVPIPGPESEKSYEQLRNHMAAHPQVLWITGDSDDNSRTNLTFREQEYIIQHDRITPDYLKAFEIKLIEGRDFDFINEASDKDNAVLVNKAFVDELQLEDPIGQQINYVGFDMQIVGVIDNFHFQSLHQNVTPLVLHMNRYEPVARMYIKTTPTGTFEVLEELKDTWRDVLPTTPLTYNFVEEQNRLQYQQEQQAKEVLTWATGLALFISCLGLFGLASLHIQQRTKEVSIKKVLGASLSQLAQDLSRDFSLLILIGWAIAIPVGVWLSNKWLEQFTYKVEISWLLFIMIGFVIFMIGLATITYHVIKTARVNPAETLKNE